ncbi:hypothetical protein Bpfe_018545 [Biomphalaria pfeifferi]|uniref:Uncharacterized protein n=1 Tax=Biomphalaria pfeifferi TaxID=112525 RepID=A0AAD8BDL3_BIOPF|nr:hypothetical protein Bpfe_018545 [Biomphalaria pfeifferi]
MSSSETQNNAIGDNLKIESIAVFVQVAGFSDVCGDEDYQKDKSRSSLTSIPHEQKESESSDFDGRDKNNSPKPSEADASSLDNSAKTNSPKPRKANASKLDENLQQDELQFDSTPHDSDTGSDADTELTLREVLHLGPTTSLTQASYIMENNGYAAWGDYIVSHGIYMVFLSFLYIVLVYASLELLYIMTK